VTLEFSDKDRAAIQSTMLGPEALDAERHPEIAFRSKGRGAGRRRFLEGHRAI
jgi:hypothetical protein